MSSARTFLLSLTFVGVLGLAACGPDDEGTDADGCPVATPGATVKGSGADGPSPSSIGGAAELAVIYRCLEHITHHADAVVVMEFTAVSSEMYEQVPFTVGQAMVRESLRGPLRAGDTITYGEVGAPVYVGGSKLDPSATVVSQVPASGGIHWIEAGESYLIFLNGPGRIGPVLEGGYAPAGAFQGKYRLLDDGTVEFDPETSREVSFTVPRLLDGRKWTDVRADIKKIVASNP